MRVSEYPVRLCPQNSRCSLNRLYSYVFIIPQKAKCVWQLKTVNFYYPLISLLINIFLVDDKSVILYIILDLNKDVKTTLPAYEESGARDIAFYFTDLDLGPVSPSPANCKGPNILLFFVLLHEKTQ